MLGNPKALKRNDRECRGILIGPPNGPSIFSALKFHSCVFLAE